jgi:NitT/TauT family transport system substrate-binding protein
MLRMTERRSLRTALIALGAFGLATAAPAPQAAAAEDVTYLIAAPIELLAFAPWVLAQKLGYYSAAGYNVKFQTARGGVDVAKQVGVGNAPIGGALGDTAIIVRQNGVPIRAVAMMGGGAFEVTVARKDKGIKELKDLKGKVVTVLSYSDTTYYALLGALAKVGLTKNDLNIQSVGPSAITSLVIAGSADACACVPDWEVDVQDALPNNTVSFPALDYFPATAQAIVASDEMIKKRPELIKAIVQATLKGMKTIMDNPAEAAKAYAAAVPSWAGKEDKVRRVFVNYIQRSYKGQKVLGEIDPKRLEVLQDFYVAQGLIEKKSPVADLYTNQFVK